MSHTHISKASEIDAATEKMYERLAEFLVEQFDISHVSIALEAGSGGGQLTVPLVKKMSGIHKLIAYDSWTGPYGKDLSILTHAISREGLNDIVEIVKGNVRQTGFAEDKVDLIVSNELFCDLDRNSLKSALREFRRILKSGGQMVHAELDPEAENRSQELLIEADLHYSLESLPFEGERWFSPTVEELQVLMHEAGFTDINVGYFRTNFRLSYEAAIEQLKRWSIDMAFAKKYENDLMRYGLEFPKEHMIKCTKP